MEIKNFGTNQTKNDSLFVPLQLSAFQSYGELVDRILEITCNDSIPLISIKNDQIVKKVFPVSECDPPPFDPKGRHYITIRNGQPYYHSSLDLINLDSLNHVIEENFRYDRNGKTIIYFVVIESNRNEKTNGIEAILNRLAETFDTLKTDVDLNIALWQVIETPPPPPSSEPKIYTGLTEN